MIKILGIVASQVTFTQAAGGVKYHYYTGGDDWGESHPLCDKG